MALLHIITVPDPVLKQVAQPVASINPLVRQQVIDMAETMYAAPGIGLAANQVNMLNRVFVMDTKFRDNTASRAYIAMINPEIIWRSDETSAMEEGCLSIPGQYAEVQRPKAVRVKYQNIGGEWQEGLFEDLASHCVQHELDHLNGIMFIDHLSSLRRDVLLRRFKKAQREASQHAL